MIRRPPRSTQSRSSAASDVYKRQEEPNRCRWEHQPTALVPEAVARLLSFPIGHLLDLTLNRHGSSLPTRQQPLLTALHSKVHPHQSPAFVHQAALGDDLTPQGTRPEEFHVPLTPNSIYLRIHPERKATI